MSNVIHFEYGEIIQREEFGYTNVSKYKTIGCGVKNPNRKIASLDMVTCGRCKRSRPYKAYKAYVLGLIDKKMLNEIGLVVSRKLA